MLKSDRHLLCPVPHRSIICALSVCRSEGLTCHENLGRACLRRQVGASGHSPLSPLQLLHGSAPASASAYSRDRRNVHACETAGTGRVQYGPFMHAMQSSGQGDMDQKCPDCLAHGHRRVTHRYIRWILFEGAFEGYFERGNRLRHLRDGAAGQG